MNIQKSAGFLSAIMIALTLAVGSTGCGEKGAEQTTATATSAGKPGTDTLPQTPAEQGMAANGGAGKQLPAPLNPPPP